MSELAINESAIRDFALRCSKTYRAGKFTRVGQDFMTELEADIECVLRELRNKGANTLHPALGQGQPIQSTVDSGTVEDNISIVKGAFLEKLEIIFNQMICRMIQNKTQRQPTVGVTLGRTR